MTNNSFGRGIDRFGALTGIAIALAFAASHLTGCDLAQPMTPSQVDSAQAALDSARHASDTTAAPAVRFSRVQVCASGAPAPATCDACTSQPFQWAIEADLAGRPVDLSLDSAECRPLGEMADTSVFRLRSYSVIGQLRHVWFVIDSFPDPLWISWAPVRMRYRDMLRVSDSVEAIPGQGLGR